MVLFNPYTGETIMKLIKKAVAKEIFQDLTEQAATLSRLSAFFAAKPGYEKNAEYYAERSNYTLNERDELLQLSPTADQPYNMVDRIIIFVCGMFRR